jgi:S1-C subfamily serine protease
MLRPLIGFLCVSLSIPAQAKLGETVPQLVKRFGRGYTVEEAELGKMYKFRSANVSVDVVVAHDRSISETYLSDHPLTASGEPPNDIVRAVLRTNVPKARWVEIEAAPFRADYALRSSDGQYIAILKYTGPQPENMIWTMTVGLVKSVPAVSTVASSSSGSPATSTAAPAPNPFASSRALTLRLSPSATPSPTVVAENTKTFYSEFDAGVAYYEGHGVKKNFAEAVKRFRRVAEGNVPQAQYLLAMCYYNGQGVPKDHVQAVKWVRKAAEQNLAVAQYALGSHYEQGDGVRRDYTEAVKWYRRAAEQNVVEAQHKLAMLYYHGAGVPKDYVEAYKWGLIVGAEDEEARKSTTILESQMSREQIAEGQRLARNFKPQEVPLAEADSSNKPAISGTGFFVSPDGYLLTNYHVVEGWRKIVVRTGDVDLPAKLVTIDAGNDLAVLKVGGSFTAIPLGHVHDVSLGDSVMTIGFPNIEVQGVAPKLTKGEVSALSGLQDDPRLFQISVPVQPGNSCGPLVDEHGNVIGVTTAQLSALAMMKSAGSVPQNVNYTVKISYAQLLIDTIPELASNLPKPNTGKVEPALIIGATKKATALILTWK